MGFAQLTIHASRSHIPTNRRPRKPFPTTPKTLGDRIQTARLENGLLKTEVAEQLGVAEKLIKLWEQDKQIPSEAQWNQLANILSVAPACD